MNVPRKKGLNLSIFASYSLVSALAGLVFYPLFPLLLNYPPGSINTKFDIEFSHIPYYLQWIIIYFCVMTVGYVCNKIAFQGTEKWNKMVTTKGKRGTGLGLYVSYSIVKGKFGGDLQFVSELGKGTVFYISIPGKPVPEGEIRNGFEKNAN